MHGNDVYLYLDCETTGPDPEKDEIVEIAIAGPDGTPLLDTLVRPVRHQAWPDAERIHGISPRMVERAPTLVELIPGIRRICSGNSIVIYNAGFDTGFLYEALDEAAGVECAMLAWAEHVGEINPRRGTYRWHKLVAAAAAVGHKWTDGGAHRAMADVLACRSVWLHMQRMSLAS